MSSYDPEDIPIDLSAFKHGIAELDIRHALAHSLMTVPTGDEGFRMTIGPSRTGEFLEIGVIWDQNGTGVVHAMVVRERFLKGWLLP